MDEIKLARKCADYESLSEYKLYNGKKGADGVATEIQVSLSVDINVITAEINAYKQTAGHALFEIGRRLKHVKENDLVHGEFTEWLRSIDTEPRTAQRLMSAYEQLGNTTMSSLLPIGKIFELIALPPDIDRQEFVSTPHTVPSTGAVKTVDEMTVRKVSHFRHNYGIVTAGVRLRRVRRRNWRSFGGATVLEGLLSCL